MWWLAMAVAWAGSEPDPLYVTRMMSDTDWFEVLTRDTEHGVVRIYRKKWPGMICLRGETETAAASTDAMLAAVTDIPSVKEWSTAGLKASEVVDQGDNWIVFHQYVDVPNWTLVRDRFWTLHGDIRPIPSGVRFQWNLASEAMRAQVAARVRETHPRAVEPPINFGAWTFVDREGRAFARYEGCLDLGGSVPKFVQRWASTRKLPDAMEEMVKEAVRRGQF